MTTNELSTPTAPLAHRAVPDPQAGDVQHTNTAATFGEARPAQPIAPPDATRVVSFWASAGPSMWFAKDPVFDLAFHDQFINCHKRAARGGLDPWASSAQGALALVLLLDQFPRNAFRNTALAYATDPQARSIADRAIAAGHDSAVDPMLALFFYLPFAHSEDPSDQERSVALARPLPPPIPAHAERHRDIVRRFGRFPHRNAILGREATPEEADYLNAGGYAG